MPDMASCRNCGGTLAPEDAFCSSCGARAAPRPEPRPDLGADPGRGGVPADTAGRPAGGTGLAQAVRVAPDEEIRPWDVPPVPVEALGSAAVYAEYDSRKLTVLTGYLAGVIGFTIGLHRLYLGKPLWWVYFCLSVLGAVGSLVLVGFVFFGILFIFLAFDLARMRGWVDESNARLRAEVFGERAS
ncbi:hypothetical protein GCM10010495_46730 [Kitasatospora herbaricolor]|nr:hypothetical protein GCM10010495_46730 [Kitasatospora herbaricolor]